MRPATLFAAAFAALMPIPVGPPCSLTLYLKNSQIIGKMHMYKLFSTVKDYTVNDYMKKIQILKY